ESWGFARLGLGTPHPVSAIHGRGSGDLLDALVEALPEPPDTGADGGDVDDGIFSVAIVGRPNVGKSTLFNRLVGDERSIVHDLPGTTRDAVDTVVETEDGPLRFVDTAGMRRRSKIDEPTEYFSLVRALQAVDRADAALLVIDAHAGVSHQDQRLAERVYATQGASDPPTFTLFATHELPPTYLRYVERKIREAFELGPTPIKLRVRRRNG